MIFVKKLFTLIVAGAFCFNSPGHSQIGEIQGGIGSAPHIPGSPITYLTGAPYSAKARHSETRTLADGTGSVAEETGIYARDSAGRNYFQTKTVERSEGAAKEPLVTTSVEDPVAHTVSEWNNRTKVVTVRALRENARPLGGEPYDLRTESSTHTSTSGRSLKSEWLGHQTIAGVEATGIRITDTIPAGVSGNDKPVVRIDESWMSIDLRIVVRTHSVGPGLSRDWELTDVRVGEPDLSPFKVPDGYTAQQ